MCFYEIVVFRPRRKMGGRNDEKIQWPHVDIILNWSSPKFRMVFVHVIEFLNFIDLLSLIFKQN